MNHCNILFLVNKEWSDAKERDYSFLHVLSGKESACQCRRFRRCGFNPWVGKIPWRRKWQPTPVFLPEKSHGQRSLASYSPWDLKESDMNEQLSTHICLCFEFCSISSSYPQYFHGHNNTTWEERD